MRMGEAKRISDPLRSGFPTSGTVMQRYSHFTSQFVFSLSQNYFEGIFCLSTSICLLNKFVSYFRAVFELLVFWIIQSLFSHIRIKVLWKDIGSTVWATVIKLLFTKSMNFILSSVVQNTLHQLNISQDSNQRPSIASETVVEQCLNCC